eukprot:TCALIF_02320-PA protein Name:"Protein of unknown function" AED:0.04 eAED:0.08 QI:0/0.77/0.5/1/0.44/0.7/10/0/292
MMIPNPCQYTICKAHDDICRTFSIAGPQVGTTSDTGLLDVGDAIGDCLTDSFQVALGEGASPGEICGFNTGQHMIYEPSDLCDELSFILGGGVSMNREWDIKVTQYKCGEENVAVMNSFFKVQLDVFNTSQKQLGVFPVITFPRPRQRWERKRLICLDKAIMSASDVNQALVPFAMFHPLWLILPLPRTSKGTDTVFDNDCGVDYLAIPLAEEFPVADPTEIGKQLICGRIFSVIDGSTVPTSVCSTSVPFILGVSTGGDEFTAKADPAKNELMMAPGGIVGFSLDYRQVPC